MVGRPTLRSALMIVAALAMALAAPDLSRSASIPDRPGIPIVHLNGQRYMVVDFRSEDPRILVDGKEETSPGAHVSLVPGTTFLPGYVKVVQGFGLTLPGQNGKRADTPEATLFDATLTADRDLNKVFALFVVFEDTTKDFSKIPQVLIIGNAVGTLRAGKPEAFEARVRAINSRMGLRWIVLLFSEGVQIRTSMGNQILDTLFDALDRNQLQKVIAERAAGTHPLMVFRRSPLAFSDPLKSRYAGRTIRVSLKVTPEGLPEIEQIDESSDANLVQEISSQLNTWLFLPGVKDGRVLEAPVIVPIKF
jgi:hypothetical protein